MSQVLRQHREFPDLMKGLTTFNRRLEALETGRRLGNTSLDGGELSIKGGDIVVRNDNNEEVLRIKHGSQPQIDMIPDYGLDGYIARLAAWEAEYGTALELGIRKTDGTQDGGKLLLMNFGTYLTKTPADGSAETYFALGIFPGWANHFYFRGRWMVGEQRTSEDGIVFGVETVGAGFGAASFNFTHAFDTTPFLQYSIFSAVGPVSHNITVLSNTGFTIGWSGTTAKTIYWQAWRR
jgi:hypothetical protein